MSPRLPNRNQIDPAIREIVIDLYENEGLETDWSCEGGPGHMTIRPIIQIRTGPWATQELLNIQRATIERVMERHGIKHYWLALVRCYGLLDNHGGELVWSLQWQTQLGDVLCVAVVPMSNEGMDGWVDTGPVNEIPQGSQIAVN